VFGPGRREEEDHLVEPNLGEGDMEGVYDLVGDGNGSGLGFDLGEIDIDIW
jgi:hypothetical protein